ncbi:NAD+ synthase [Meridianimarinicoccus roseus]|uniref:Glutamine-dependent NAD(+) synthetase n=1 Tax=Meridianimarinicoccus roseus TaxID=2072018 RepID=A0A2V2L8Y9_9RHOB|nr:NAD+ synthase [Meridianimarinicoccus roseus]PWR01695.1 NAD+ synthase [Meridianimarinicoccus roseus]
MADTFRITLAQLNPVVGDLAANAAQARAAWDEGRGAGAGLVALTEMFITGYQIQDLVRKNAFVRDAMAAIDRLAAECADGPALAVGGPFLEDGRLYNAYHVCVGGRVVTRVLKHKLPNTDVFDEVRFYTPGPISGPVRIGPLRIGMPVCEDAWSSDVAEAQAESGAEVLLVPNGSPYHRDKHDERLAHMVARGVETGLPLIYLNMVGGQDDQVFDGASFGLNPGGRLAFQMPDFVTAVRHVDLDRGPDGWRIAPGPVSARPESLEQDYHAMCLGLSDYLAKSGFSKVVLGLSGGVDSALVAAIAADALGPDKVRCVMLPSRYTSQASLDDAADAAGRLGTKLDTLPIGGPVDAVTETLAPLFEGRAPDLTEENMQSRLRGVLLMALSNKCGEMLLTTGNKSEVAVGYSTIYGDMAGGYNPIKDLYKTRVFDICNWRNDNHRDWMQAPAGAVIPPQIISKPPTAELREDQKDEDSLPPYPVLDRILTMLVDEDASVADVAASGIDRATVEKIEHLVYISEYKRYQAAPGARLSKRSFWLDRRYPIVNRWRDRG